MEKINGAWTSQHKDLDGDGSGDFVNGKPDTVSNSVTVVDDVLTIASGVEVDRVRASNYKMTVEQMLIIHHADSYCYQDGAQSLLSGNSDACQSCDFDENSGLLHVSTDSHKSTFRGLARVSSEPNSYTTLTADSNYIAKGN